MHVSINKHYFFKFISQFSKLDGIYFVERALVYADLIKEDIDLSKTLYSKMEVGIHADEPTTEDIAAFELAYQTNPVVPVTPEIADVEEIKVGNYLNSVFYKLVSMDNGVSFTWVPEDIIVGYPDPNVKEYNRVMLLTDLGVIEDGALIEAISDVVRSTIISKVGALAIYDNTSANYDDEASHPTPENHTVGEPILPYYTDAKGSPRTTYGTQSTVYNPSLPISADNHLATDSNPIDNTNHQIGDPIPTPDNPSDESINPIVNLSVYGSQWMTIADYETLTTSRLSSKDMERDLFVNYQLQFLEYKKKYTQALNKIAALEAVIVQQNTPPVVPE